MVLTGLTKCQVIQFRRTKRGVPRASYVIHCPCRYYIISQTSLPCLVPPPPFSAFSSLFSVQRLQKSFSPSVFFLLEQRIRSSFVFFSYFRGKTVSPLFPHQQKIVKWAHRGEKGLKKDKTHRAIVVGGNSRPLYSQPWGPSYKIRFLRLVGDRVSLWLL